MRPLSDLKSMQSVGRSWSIEEVVVGIVIENCWFSINPSSISVPGQPRQLKWLLKSSVYKHISLTIHIIVSKHYLHDELRKKWKKKSLLFITLLYGFYIKVSNKAFNRNISNIYEWFSAGKKKYFGSLSRTVTSMTYSPLITLEITCARYILFNLKSKIRQRAKPLLLPQIYSCDREGMSTSHFLLRQTWRVRFPNNQLSFFEKQYSIFITCSLACDVFFHSWYDIPGHTSLWMFYSEERLTF